MVGSGGRALKPRVIVVFCSNINNTGKQYFLWGITIFCGVPRENLLRLGCFGCWCVPTFLVCIVYFTELKFTFTVNFKRWIDNRIKYEIKLSKSMKSLAQALILNSDMALIWNEIVFS